MKPISFLLLLFLSSNLWGQSLSEIDRLIEKELESGSVPALAVAIIDSGQVVHRTASGYLDLENKIPVGTDGTFHIASVSKTVTNMAIFKLVEMGKLTLDEDINTYLPFPVQNPHYPTDPITIRKLLNHRSGIRDDYEWYAPFWNEPKGDPTLGLVDYLENYLDPDGDSYKESHYESSADYAAFSYCNTAYALLGLIVELVAEQPYEAFCQEQIFKPLEMENTSWFLKNLPLDKVVKTYARDDSLGLVFKGYNGYPDYPAGQLRTSIIDYSNLIKAYLLAENGEFILSAATTEMITPVPQIAHDGYFTWFQNAMGNHLYYSHEGGDVGVRTVVMIDVNENNAVIIFANAGYRLGNLLRAIEMEMWGE